MDASPDPTVVLTALKDFQTFLGNSRTSSASRGTEPRRLNFSTLSRDNSSASLPSPNSPGYLRGQKRNLDSIVGFDVSKKLREKDGEIITTQATVTRLQGRIHEMELTNKKNKLESDAEIRAMQHQRQRDKELIDDLQHKLKKIQKEKEETRDSVKSARAQWDTANLEAETRVNKLQQTYLEQTTKLKEEINSLQEQVADLEKEVAEKTSKVTLAENHTEVVESTTG
ncbi:hypothetical protein O3P69_001463 [Scylla paramamosain]|uniref:Uncharacterized protein n=1 Tax=Scylla paramamosain TaxID=85552 RepID=A0AAW0UXN5_SCYPA